MNSIVFSILCSQVSLFVCVYALRFCTQVTKVLVNKEFSCFWVYILAFSRNYFELVLSQYLINFQAFNNQNKQHWNKF